MFENIFVLTKKLFDVFIEEYGEYEDCGDLVKSIWKLRISIRGMKTNIFANIFVKISDKLFV